MATSTALERKGGPAAVETVGIRVPFPCNLLLPARSTSENQTYNHFSAVALLPPTQGKMMQCIVCDE